MNLPWNVFQAEPAECASKEYDRALTKQFMHGIADKGMISEI